MNKYCTVYTETNSLPQERISVLLYVCVVLHIGYSVNHNNWGPLL